MQKMWWFALALATPIAQAQVVVPVKEILSESVLAQAGPQLQPEAIVQNARARFSLTTPIGVTEVTGTVSMLERVAEVRAVEALEAMKKTDVYKDALKSSAKGPVEFGKSLVNEPVGTVTDTAKGLGGFLADLGHSIVSDDPSQENVAKTALGHATARRNLAYQLGVNPYTRYEPLEEALSEVSWAAVGGGLTITAAFRAINNTAGSVLTRTKTANMGRQLVRDNSPRKLGNINMETLQSMGVREDLAESLLNNHRYDPESETRLGSALAGMEKVSGRVDVVALSALVSSHNRAEEMRDWVELLAAYHELKTPARLLVVVSSAIFLIDSDNTAHGVFPTDYVMWTASGSVDVERVTRKVQAMGYKLGPIHATGAVENRMTKMLTDLGWSSVTDHLEDELRTQ